MNQDTGHKLVWSWLRLLLGWLQMSLAVAGFGALLVLGHHPLTWALALAALVAVVISRVLYHGKADPKLKWEKGDG